MKKMKKMLSALIAVLLLVGVLVACTQTEEPEEPEVISPPVDVETPEQEQTPPQTSLGVTSANVQVHLATDEFLARFDSYHEFVDPDESGGQRVVITTDVPINHLQFAELRPSYFGVNEWDGESYEFWDLYLLDELTPERPFVVNWMNWGAIPHRGISFWNENYPYNVFFAIHQSGYDGSLLLIEVASRVPSSPRDHTTGLLEAAEHEWTEIVVSTGLTWSIELEEVVWAETLSLNQEDAQRVYEILSTIDAVEVLTPFHYESQQTDPLFQIVILYDNGSDVRVFSVEGSSTFFRFTDTFGNHGDPGFVFSTSDEVFNILSANF